MQAPVSASPHTDLKEQNTLLKRESASLRESITGLQQQLKESKEEVQQLHSQGSSLHSQYCASETTKSITSKVSFNNYAMCGHYDKYRLLAYLHIMLSNVRSARLCDCQELHLFMEMSYVSDQVRRAASKHASCWANCRSCWS